MKKLLSLLVIAFLLFATTACSSSESTTSAIDDFTNIFSDSAAVSSVKGGTVQACPSSTLGEMADAFMSNPQWSDFTSDTGGTVVELDGDITYDGLPATALIQFDVIGSTFEAVYLGINGVDQSTLMLSSLLTKMCDATF